MLDKIYNNNNINKYLNHIIGQNFPGNYDLQNDFKSHFWLQMGEMDQIKLSNMSDKDLEYYCFRVIKNQVSKSSSFYKEFRNGGFPSSKIINDTIDIAIELEDEIEDKIEFEKKMDIVNKYLTSIHWYHSALFKLYYFKNMTVRDLKKSGIQYRSLRRSLDQSLLELKKEFKDNGLRD
jgi:hypothetical protein